MLINDVPGQSVLTETRPPRRQQLRPWGCEVCVRPMWPHPTEKVGLLNVLELFTVSDIKVPTFFRVTGVVPSIICKVPNVMVFIYVWAACRFRHFGF